jgi:protein-S-isoprenylcysteine O-methyltransferase Ste14
MMGTLGVLLPWHVSHTKGLEDVLARPVSSTPMVAALLLIAGIVSTTWSCRDLLNDNDGTPDPFDPPMKWQTAGLYRRWRHPMQVGQLCCFAASAAMLGTVGGWLSVAMVAVVLVGPVRAWEGHAGRRFSAAPGL